jgi:hypothetical protein
MHLNYRIETQLPRFDPPAYPQLVVAAADYPQAKPPTKTAPEVIEGRSSLQMVAKPATDQRDGSAPRSLASFVRKVFNV